MTKSKILAKACCCCWTNDGQYFAVGHYNGIITIWTKVQFHPVIVVSKCTLDDIQGTVHVMLNLLVGFMYIY